MAPSPKKKTAPVRPLLVKTLDVYLLKQFFPIFFVSIFMFITLILLIDLFVNLFRFLNNGAAVADILKNSALYVPKALLYALPVSLLFASAYTLGDLYVRNEIPSVLCSGVPFWRICIPLFILGLVVSFCSFFFEDRIVLPALWEKDLLARRILRIQSEESSTNVVIKAENGRLVYVVDYYDDRDEVINGVSIVELDEEGKFVSLIRTQRAKWNNNFWEMFNPVLYAWKDGFMRPLHIADETRYREEPDTFKRNLVQTEYLNARNAALAIQDLKASGLPFIEALADYHHRFAFSSVPFVVIFLSVTLGGRFRKNILLMNLLSSLGTAVVFYVTEMISMMVAKIGILPPVAGAWMPVLVCIAGGFYLLSRSRT